MNKFKYYGMMYLNDWFQSDKVFVAGISSKNTTESLKVFNRAAKYYKVTRNFPVLEGEERLAMARKLVLNVRDPITDKNVSKKVEALSDRFKASYGRNAVSAASKFLWLRFKCPVVIYDSRALAWLRCNDYDVSSSDGYDVYRKCWLEAFSDDLPEIKKACEGLYKVKSYSLACDESDKDIINVTQSRWFQERVFDKYLWFNAGGD